MSEEYYAIPITHEFVCELEEGIGYHRGRVTRLYKAKPNEKLSTIVVELHHLEDEVEPLVVMSSKEDELRGIGERCSELYSRYCRILAELQAVAREMGHPIIARQAAISVRYLSTFQ